MRLCRHSFHAFLRPFAPGARPGIRLSSLRKENSTMDPKFDEVGQWTQIKLEILRKYASVYSTILASQTSPRLTNFYIDGFSGAGTHLSKVTGEPVEGSPRSGL